MKAHVLYSLLIALVVSLGGFLLGFDGAVISGAIPFYKLSFGLSDNPYLVGLSVSSIVAGSIFGNFIAGYVSDRIGRKPTLIITSILFLIGSLGTAIADNVSIFILYRMIGGIGVGMAILAAPMYIAEIAPPRQRGKLVTFNQLNIVLGLSVAYFSNYFILQAIEDPELNWRWMLGIGGVPALVYFLLLLFVPESPRWLIQKGKEEKGKLILKKAGGEEHALSEFENIKRSLSKVKSKASIRDLFSSGMKYVLLIGLALAFFQQISGINAVLYYAPLIFETAGGGRDAAFLQSIIIGLVFTGGTVLSMFLIDRLGRKPLLIIGSGIMLVSLFVVGLSFQMATYELDQADVQKITHSLQKEIILQEATLQNSAAYAHDSIVLSTEKGLIYRKGIVSAEVDLNKQSVRSSFTQIGKLESVLNSCIGKTYTGELNFFSTLKTNLEASGLSLDTYKSSILTHSITIQTAWVLIGVLGFIIGFSISLGPVMWAMLSEIFPNRLRGLAISVAGTFNALTSFFVASIFPVELDYLGSAATYFIFAGFMALCLFVVWKFIPETKGKSLEEIEKELVGDKFKGELKHKEDIANDKDEELFIYVGH